MVRALAALVALYPGEMRERVAGKATTVHTLLVQTAEPPKAEWLLNFTRQKLALPENVMPRSEAGRQEPGFRYGSQGAQIVLNHSDKPLFPDVGPQAIGICVSSFKGPCDLERKWKPRASGYMDKSILRWSDRGRLPRLAANLASRELSLVRGLQRHGPSGPSPDKKPSTVRI